MYSASPNNPPPSHKQAPWFGAYQEIERVAYEILDANGGAVIMFDELTATNVTNQIKSAVGTLMVQHAGDPNWEMAYQLWYNNMFNHEEEQ